MSVLYTLSTIAFLCIGAFRLYVTVSDSYGQSKFRAAALPVNVWALVLCALGAVSLWGALTAEDGDFERVLCILAAIAAVLLIAEILMPTGARTPFPLRIAGRALVVLIPVLALRTLVLEPYRIPSDSMMPSLQEGDRILVQKYAYGLRLPLSDHPFYRRAAPARGDVVVFRYPPDPRITYVKRIVGLPGDMVEIRDDRVLINGEPLPEGEARMLDDPCYLGMTERVAITGGHRHLTLSCHSALPITVRTGSPSCPRLEDTHHLCRTTVGNDAGNSSPVRVPPHSYFVVGDNRDNSEDSRVWGTVDEDLILGRAQRIWFSTSTQGDGTHIHWNRIGTRIP